MDGVADAGQVQAGHAQHFFAAAVFQIDVWQAKMQDRQRHAMRSQAFGHGGTGAAGDGVVFQR